jgi:hypothetical protein
MAEILATHPPSVFSLAPERTRTTHTNCFAYQKIANNERKQTGWDQNIVSAKTQRSGQRSRRGGRRGNERERRVRERRGSIAT